MANPREFADHQIIIGCGSVGREVTSNTRGPQFEYRHRQNLLMNTFTVNCWKDENKENEVGNGPIVKNIYKNFVCFKYIYFISHQNRGQNQSNHLPPPTHRHGYLRMHIHCHLLLKRFDQRKLIYFITVQLTSCFDSTLQVYLVSSQHKQSKAAEYNYVK